MQSTPGIGLRSCGLIGVLAAGWGFALPAIALHAQAAAPIVFDSDRAGAAEIFALAPDGSVLVRITFGQAPGAFSRLPDWSPDCRWIAFQSNRDDLENTDIYIAAADGTTVRRLTHGPVAEESPAWSPDGSQLAFSLEVGESEEIWLVDIDGSNRRLLTPDATPAFQPAWSADGSHIAFVSGSDENWDLFVARIDGSEIRNITNTPDRHEGGPAYSPDGKTIAFDALRGGQWEIYLVDANGSDEHQLTHNTSMDARPAWSPDGSEIVFHSTRAFGTDGDIRDYNQVELYVMRADGTNVRRLTENDHFDAHPDWCGRK